MEISEIPNAKKKISDYATIRSEMKDNQKVFILHANAKNNLGTIVLKATYDNVEYTKTVEIIPLW